MGDIFNSISSIQILTLAFLAILFLQSGLDKIFNYKDNYMYFKSHFSKSILKNTIDGLMPVITLLEMSAGVMSAIGVIQILMAGSTQLGLIGAQLASLTLLSLFFGQRIAKDYEGAWTLATYFLVSLVANFALI